MPDLKLAQIVEGVHPDLVRPALELFFGPDIEQVLLDSTRVEPPEAYWAVYRFGERRVVLKSFFQEADFETCLGELEQAYPDRLDQPRHPDGGVTFLPQLNAILWAFPFDPAMPGLARSADGRWIAGVMRRRRGKPLAMSVVSYRPEIGALLSYRPEGSRRPLAYAKVNPDETCGLVYVVMNRLWDSEARKDQRLRLAQPLAFRPDYGLLLQAPVPGRPLDGHRNRRIFFELAGYAGQALAALQAIEAPFGPSRDLASLTHRLENRQEEARMLAPRLYPLLRDLTIQIQERSKREHFDQSGPAHGDYKWDQFLESRGRFSLIDFEFFCQADPAYDAGYFAAYLPPSRPEDWREGAAGEMSRSAFLTAYAEASDAQVPWSRIALYEAAMLAIRGFSHVWGQREGWELMASQLISLGFERLVNPEPGSVELS